MSEYPDIQRGTQFGQVPARQWQNVFEDLRRVASMTVGPGLILDKGVTNYRITRMQPQPTKQVSAVVAGVVTQQFKLFIVDDDHLVCRTWDSKTSTEGTRNILIAKPYLLRRTPFDGQTRGVISYVYLSSTSRNATVGTDTKRQRIIPKYRDGDIIYASGPVVGATDVIVRVSPNPADDIRLDWVDDNRDARAWAWEFE